MLNSYEMRLRAALVSALLLLISPAAESVDFIKSHYPACASHKLYLVESSDPSPCFDPDAVPSSSLLAPFSRVLDWLKAIEFAKLAGRFRVDLDKDNHVPMEQMQGCLAKLDTWDALKAPIDDKCQNYIKIIKTKVIPASNKLRIALALAHPRDASGPFNAANYDRFLNKTLQRHPGWPLGSRNPLDATEANEVNQIFESYLEKIKLRFQKKMEASLNQRNPEFVKPEIRERLEAFKRAGPLEAYKIGWPEWQMYQKNQVEVIHRGFQAYALDLLTQHPMAGLISRKDPSPKDTLEALQEMMGKNKKHQSWLTQLLTHVSTNESASKEDVNSLLESPQINNLVLEKHPEYCGIAESLVLHGQKRDLAKSALNYVTTTALLVEALPAVIATPLVIGQMGTRTYTDYQEFMRLSDEALTSLTPDTNLTDMKSARAAGRALMQDLASLSINLRR